MESTRPLNLITFELHTFPINETPPYLAISHVCSQGLFAPFYLGNFSHCEGTKMTQSLLKQRSELSPLRYCWVIAGPSIKTILRTRLAKSL